MLFALYLERKFNDALFIRHVAGFNARMTKSVGSQFFSGRASYVPVNPDDALVVIDLNVLFPPVHYFFGLVALVSIIIFRSWTGFLVMAGLFSLFSFLRIKYLYAWLFKKSLRKAGYDGSVRLL